MEYLRFEWDNSKNLVNQRKHGVSFEEAKSVFYDEKAVEFYDENHSQKESRFLILGMSYQLRLLIFCHCFRKSESVIRIISARKVTANEAKFYGGKLK